MSDKTVDINTINNQLDTLETTKFQIKQAIIAKGQPVEDSDTFRSYANKISNIETGVNTSDANATIFDITLNKTAYVNGVKIIGTIDDTVTGIDCNSSKPVEIVSNLSQLDITGYYYKDNKHSTLIPPYTNFASTIHVANSNLANAIGLTSEVLKNNVTILNITGSLDDTGINTADATAVPNQLKSGETAYVNGVKITGKATIINTVSGNNLGTYVRTDMYKNGSPVDDGTSTGHRSALNNIKFATVENIDYIGLITPAYGNTNPNERTLFMESDRLGVRVPQNLFVERINLTSNIIKDGVNILGVTGNLSELNGINLDVTLSTTSQSLTPESPYNGFTVVNIPAVTNSIDANITAENIRKDVNILGVVGNIVEVNNEPVRSITPSTTQQDITPSQGYTGLSEVIVNAISIENKTVKSTTTSQIISPTSGSYINEITVNPIILENISIEPSTSVQTLSPTSGNDGINVITVNAVTNNIDVNIIANNIKDGVNILGVVGNLSELNGTSLNVIPSTIAQTLTPESPYNGFTVVNIDAVDSTIDSNIVNDNIKVGVNILGVSGSFTSDANAIADDIAYGKTAYVNGIKLVGTMENLEPVIQNQANIINNLYNTVNNLQTEIDNKSGNFMNFVVPDGMKFAYSSSLFRGGSTWDLSQVTNTYYMFFNCKNLKDIDLAEWDVSQVTNMANMFSFCSNIKTLNVNNWNTSQVNNMFSTFSYCSNLTYVGVNNWDTSNVVNMHRMFESCTKLVDLDISNWNVTKVSNLARLVSLCNNLSNDSIQNVINVCLNATNIDSSLKNIANKNTNSPFFSTIFDNSYYTNRWTELTEAGWTY